MTNCCCSFTVSSTGAVIWAEKTLPSSLVGMLVASEAIWLVMIDKANWKTNFKSGKTLLGLLIGFAGVLLLFSESSIKLASQAGGSEAIIGFIVLVIGTISWAGGKKQQHYPGNSSMFYLCRIEKFFLF